MVVDRKGKTPIPANEACLPNSVYISTEFISIYMAKRKKEPINVNINPISAPIFIFITFFLMPICNQSGVVLLLTMLIVTTLDLLYYIINFLYVGKKILFGLFCFMGISSLFSFLIY